MRWLQSTYTVRFNGKHRLCGHLFQGRYKSLVVDPEEGNYFAVLSDYIHLNPVRALLVRPEDRLVDYRWSSYPAYVTRRDRGLWLEVNRVLGELGVEDTVVGGRQYAERMRERAAATLSGADGAELARIRRGWCLGGRASESGSCVCSEEPERGRSGAVMTLRGRGTWTWRGGSASAD